jgi:D-alanyl-D-alanine carboxypeptidase
MAVGIIIAVFDLLLFVSVAGFLFCAAGSFLETAGNHRRQAVNWFALGLSISRVLMVLCFFAALCACQRQGFSASGELPGGGEIGHISSSTDSNGTSSSGKTESDREHENIPPHHERGDNSDEGGKGSTDTDFELDLLLLVNREHALEHDYAPDDLTPVQVRLAPGIVPERRLMRQPAALALKALFDEAESQNIVLYALSGYRSYDSQELIYNAKLKADGQAEADRYIARPGHSEHQSGLAMDVVSEDGIGRELNPEFGLTGEGRWLASNCFNFGFIIRYPEGKEEVTGYSYEPWHLRYVGESAAKIICSREITLEEFWDLAQPNG